MNEVVKLYPADDPDVVLDAAKGCEAVVVLTINDGRVDVAASTNLTTDQVLAHLVRAQVSITVTELADD